MCCVYNTIVYGEVRCGVVQSQWDSRSKSVRRNFVQILIAKKYYFARACFVCLLLWHDDD